MFVSFTVFIIRSLSTKVKPVCKILRSVSVFFFRAAFFAA
nr:MAG TPA: hypothetical protein [Caudoviricetes sp.]